MSDDQPERKGADQPSAESPHQAGSAQLSTDEEVKLLDASTDAPALAPAPEEPQSAFGAAAPAVDVVTREPAPLLLPETAAPTAAAERDAQAWPASETSAQADGNAPSTVAKTETVPESTDDIAAEHEQGARHPMSSLARGAALIIGAGASLSLGAWELWHRDALVQYVSSNKIDPGMRKQLLYFAAVGIAVPVVAMLIFALVRRKRPNAVCATIEAVGWKGSPLCLAAFVPLLFQWQLWKKNDINFLILAGAVAFCLQKVLYRAFSAPTVVSWRPGYWDPLCSKLARLRDGSSSWLPWVIVVGLFVFYASYFSFYTIQNHWNLRTAAYDLAIEDNVVYNAMYGKLLKASPMFGPEGTHLGHHATFFAFALAPFYAISPAPETLLIIQAVLIGAAVIPLFLFARGRLGPWYAAVIAALYVLYAPLHGANLYDFHYPPLGIGFVFWTMFLVDTKRDKWAAVALLLALSVREDIALAIFGVGAYFLLSNRRPKAGFTLAATGLCYFVVMKMGVMPAIRDGKESFAWYYKDLVPPGGPKGFRGILTTIIGNPAYTLGRLVQTKKILYLLQVITPFAFLPWRRGIGFVFCLSGLVITLLAHRSAAHEISFQYTSHWAIGLFLAVVVILTMTKKPAWPGDQRGDARVASWIGALVFAMLATSYQHGAILQHNTARGGFSLFKFDRTQKDIERYDALRSLVGVMPPNAKVASTSHLLPHMSNRPDAYTIRTVGIRDAEYIIFPQKIGGNDLKRIHPQLEKGTFGIVAQAQDMYLAQRGYSTERNGDVLKRLRRPPKKKSAKRPTLANPKLKSKTKPKPKTTTKPKTKLKPKTTPTPRAQPTP